MTKRFGYQSRLNSRRHDKRLNVPRSSGITYYIRGERSFPQPFLFHLVPLFIFVLCMITEILSEILTI